MVAVTAIEMCPLTLVHADLPFPAAESTASARIARLHLLRIGSIPYRCGRRIPVRSVAMATAFGPAATAIFLFVFSVLFLFMLQFQLLWFLFLLQLQLMLLKFQFLSLLEILCLLLLDLI